MSDGFDLSRLTGLTGKEAARRLGREGFNEIPSGRAAGFLDSVLSVVREPMFVLLVSCGVTYLVLGELREALLLLGFVAVVMGITIYQERKTERALEALRDLSSPRALVVRDHELKRIAGKEVVRGDLLVLAEGDRVPVDGILLACLNMAVDESLLTGESNPVPKQACRTQLYEPTSYVGQAFQPAVAVPSATHMCRPGGDDNFCVFSGTLVVEGRGVARVEATGIKTEIGKIGKALQTIQTEETALQKETDRLVRKIAAIRLGVVRDSRHSLRCIQGKLVGRDLGRHNPCHGLGSGRVPRSLDHIPGSGCVADVTHAGVDPSSPGDRNPRCGNCPVRRQDRHSDAKRDGRACPLRQREVPRSQ